VRFAVLGAGAIGAYLGATLAQAGSDVTLIARGPHLQAMIEHGVRVQSPRGDFTSHPAATADIDALAEADVIVIGLKAHSLPELAPAIGKRLRRAPWSCPPRTGCRGGTSRGRAARSPGARSRASTPAA
jgi:2-dehydropantoate 2-reductase